ncbi:MAG TPA: NADH-quinone oxidoreductase subunit L [Phnomibacter sp.]|nr:NADH-quinone oxidoreductase subunit L [Phnomibacter sp.]
MNYALFSVLLLVLPLASFVVLGIWGRKYFTKSAGILGTLVLGTITAFSLCIAYHYFLVDGQLNGTYQPILAVHSTWLQFGYKDLSIDMGILLDPISVMMLVVITVVSLMVHIFSLGYMKNEERYATYFAFLSLFTFSMLGLVIAVNIFQIYMFWELVGVSSYLLIGFFFTKPSAVAASKKAFIVTRFADLGFLIGILMLGIQAGTLDFDTLISRLANPQSEAFMAMTTTGFLGISSLTWALCLVFMGGAGKSAMFPLHVWLPDAMEGPTPVSALIHAATMVVAGVYLVARLFPIFQVDEVAQNIVAWVGAVSALFAAVIAITQTDIKRVLAYSTMSQIGYMMFALGVSGYGGEHGLGFTASMFHLFTHAFFKSLLFLGAGAVIHFVHSNDMTDMGGLRKYMPVTHISFLLACLAIAGVPPLSGFFSKEEILLAAFEGNKAIYFIALFTAGLTAFYMFRLYFMIFWQKDKSYTGHHGEGPVSMKLPLIILSVFTVLSGLIPFSHYVSSDGKAFNTEFHLMFSLAPIAVVVIGIGLAFSFYKTSNDKPAKLSAAFGSLYRSAYNKFYIDELYQFVTHKIIFRFVGKPAAWIDRNIVDGSINTAANATEDVSYMLKGWQSGKVQQYAMYFFVGILALSFLFIYLWN